MYVYDKEQREEFQKIVGFLLSKDLEISKMGLELLRASKVYRGLKPQTVFYYPKKFDVPQKRVRLSTFVNSKLRLLYSDCNSTNVRAKAKYALKMMFDDLLSCDASKFFRREFINTSHFL